MKYTGKLAKPVVGKRHNLLLAEALRGESSLLESTYREVWEKLPELFKAHGVENGNWVALAMRLAQAHVPGFKVVNPPGRPNEWGVSDKAELKVDADALIAEAKINGKNLSVNSALKKLKRTEKWADRIGEMTEGALAKHYYAAEPIWVEIAKKARLYDEMVPLN